MNALLIVGRRDARKVRPVGMPTAATAVLRMASGMVRVFVHGLPGADFGLAGRTVEALGRAARVEHG